MTYIFKEIINIPADFIKLIDTLQYKNSVDILAKEISILKPHFIFFSNLDSISTLNDSPVNYTAKYDLLKDVFKMNITINDRGLNKYISVIEGDKKMDYLCFDLETYDSKLVYDFVSSLNVYNPMSQLKLYKNNNTSRLNNIKIFDFHSHKNTEINIVNNMLALVGENDVGKTSVLQALDMFFQKDEEMENHIKVEIDGKILSLESIKNKEINYFLFGSEIFSNSDIDRRTISELIDYKNENLANRNQSKRLKEQMYDILDIFKHIYDIYEFMELDIEIDKECGNLFHYSEEIKKIIDLFLEKRI